jgi:hypothetical protein
LFQLLTAIFSVLNQVYAYFKTPTRSSKEVIDPEIWTEEVKKEKQEQAIAEAGELLNKACLGFDDAIESLRGGGGEQCGKKG